MIFLEEFIILFVTKMNHFNKEFNLKYTTSHMPNIII